MSVNEITPNQPTVTAQTRDVIKSGIALPLVGTVPLVAIGIIGILYFLNKRKRSITLGV